MTSSPRRSRDSRAADSVDVTAPGRPVARTATLACPSSISTDTASTDESPAMSVLASSIASGHACPDDTSVPSARGLGTTLRLTDVTIASAPHDPCRNRGISNPLTFFTTMPPAFATSPSPRTNSHPMSKSFNVPERSLRAPANPVATTPPTVVVSGDGISSGSSWPCSPNTR